MAFKLRMETLEQRETPAGFEPVDPITGLPIHQQPKDQTPPPAPGSPTNPVPDFPIPR